MMKQDHTPLTLSRPKVTVKAVALWRRIPPALLLLLVPLFSWADGFNLGSDFLSGLLVWALVFLCLLVFWCVLSFKLYFRLHKQNASTALGWALFFFVSPALLFAGWISSKDYLFGYTTIRRTEMTQEPRVIAGITFPVGSQITYEQSGGFFGGHAQRVLLEIRSPHPISLGALRIDGYRPGDGTDSAINNALFLAGDQIIEGWPCDAGSAIVTLDHNAPHLQACALSSPYRWRGKLLPIGTMVIRQGSAPALPIYEQEETSP